MTAPRVDYLTEAHTHRQHAWAQGRDYFEMARLAGAWTCGLCGQAHEAGSVGYFAIRYPNRVADLVLSCGTCMQGTPTHRWGPPDA